MALKSSQSCSNLDTATCKILNFPKGTEVTVLSQITSEDFFRQDDLISLVKQIKLQDKRIEARKKQLDLLSKRQSKLSLEHTAKVEDAGSSTNAQITAQLPKLAIKEVDDVNNQPQPQAPGAASHPLPAKPRSAITPEVIVRPVPETTSLGRQKQAAGPQHVKDPQLELFESVGL